MSSLRVTCIKLKMFPDSQGSDEGVILLDIGGDPSDQRMRCLHALHSHLSGDRHLPKMSPRQHIEQRRLPAATERRLRAVQCGTCLDPMMANT